MKLRWKVMIGLVVVGIATAVTLSRRASSELRALEQTRRELRAQGFKIDVSEFDFSAPHEFHVRIGAITNLFNENLRRNSEYSSRRSLLNQIGPKLMENIGRDAALPLWKQRQWPLDADTAYSLQFSDFPKGDLWPVLRAKLNEDEAQLNAAGAAILSGRIRVPLDASRGSSILLPHLAAWKNLSQTFGSRVLLELHDGNLDAAWTNVLAATRLITAWDTEPVEISHLVRVACVGITFNITWQALQTNGWSDAQLGQLQQEWESVDFFKALPETAALSRAGAAQSCQLERSEPWDDSGYGGSVAKQFFDSPKDAWTNLRYRWQMVRYRRHGSFEDEKNLLLYYRDRELELRKTSQAETWSEMRALPGATNIVPFQTKNPSRVSAMMNLRQLSLSAQMYSAGGSSRTVTARAAEAEARRRLLITAVALERSHKRDGRYPKSLAELSPDFLKTPLLDFMDGQPLRYQTTDDGHFVLYSVGLDCADNGGKIQRTLPEELLADRARGLPRGRSESDIVWPRPASDADVVAFQREQIRAKADQKQREDEQQAALQWSTTAGKQLRAGKILAANSSGTSVEPKYQGRPLVEVLGNQNGLSTNVIRITELLTLKRVPTEAEPEALTFDVPISYDVLTNLGQLVLLVDRIKDETFIEDSQGCWVELRRATNGNCLLTWNTIYESPGLHALQLALACSDPASDEESPLLVGPAAAFTVSNLCQFSVSSAYFQPELGGATLRAKLAEPNATYSLEITSPAGELLKTITGNTSNGLMTIYWDLVDDRGVRRTNSSFNTLVHLKLQDSGRSQTLRGP